MRTAAAFVLLVVLVLVTPLVAWGSAPGESELFRACLVEGQRGVNSAGMDRNAFCQCVAVEASTRLAPNARRAMTLEMEGRRREARDITSRMGEREQMATLESTAAVFEKCAVGTGERAPVASQSRTGEPTSRAGSGGDPGARPASGAPAGRYRAAAAGITLDFLDSRKVRVTIADGDEEESADGSFDVQGDRVTVRVPGGMPLELRNLGPVLEGDMDGEKVRFERM